MKKNTRASGLLQSGLIFSAASFLTGIGNYAFQAIIGRLLKENGEYGLANSSLVFIGLLSLPLAIATTAVTHYISRFNFSGDDARLQGLLGGCRKFLFWLTIGGSVLAVLLIKPLSDFFHFPRTSLTICALIGVLAGLWGAFATALCQGLAWFKRLALIGILGVGLRLAFGGFAAMKYPVAETAVLALGVALLANLVLLFWKKDLARPAQAISPWNREFLEFLLIAAACVIGGYCFTQGDMLVAKRFFSNADLDAYSCAERLAAALPVVVGPLLAVLFTHRSGQQHHAAMREQFKLLGLYAAGLVGGAAALFLLRDFCVRLIFGRPAPEAATLIAPLAVTMVFVGLLQALALWALASRWAKISLLYGGLGITYWLILLGLGKTPAALLQTMPVVGGLAFGILFCVWLVTMKRQKLAVKN